MMLLPALLIATFASASRTASAPSGGTPSEPLSAVLAPEFFAHAYWQEALAEIAVYGFHHTELAEGEDEVTFVTQRIDVNREFQVELRWPPGQKPHYPAIRQTTIGATSRHGESVQTASHLFLEISGQPRAQRYQVIRTDWSGTLTKDFHFGVEPWVLHFMSPIDGEGRGSFTFPANHQARLEEELPILLRGLRFKDGLSTTFQLYTSQITTSAQRPVAHAARATVTAEAESWVVEVESSDGRLQEFRFDVAFPHLLRSWAHSDGRRLELKTHRREAYWLPQP
jgi:hypothetical protein